MSNTVLSSFDPLAVHPFTNNSGLLPKPAAPSQYPHPTSKAAPAHAAHGPIILTTTPMHAPQPKRSSANHSNSSGNKPVFVTFSPDRSNSPELETMFLKKKLADALVHNKPQWVIDQVPARAVPSMGRQGRAQ